MSRVDEALRLAAASTADAPPDDSPAYPSQGPIYFHSPLDAFDGGAAVQEGTNRPRPGMLVECTRLIWRHKRTVLLIALPVTMAAVLLSLLQTPVYRARAVLEIQDVNRDFLNTKSVTPIGEGANYAVIADMQTQIGILQSDSVLRRALETVEGKQSPAAVAGGSGATAITPALVDRTRLNLSVQTAGQTRLVEVTFTDAAARRAADLVNAVAEAFVAQTVETRTKVAEHTGTSLNRELDAVRRKLEQSESALQLYAQQAGLLLTGDQHNIAEDRLRQLQDELSKATAERVEKQSRLVTIDNSPPSTIPDILDDQTLRENQTALTELKRRVADLSTIFTPDYPAVLKLNAEIAALQEESSRTREAIIGRIRNEYQEAARRERLLKADYDAQGRLLGRQGHSLIQYRILKREVDTNRQFFEAMLQRVRETNLASAVPTSNVRIVDGAAVPRRPYKPRLPLNLALGVIVGTVLGVGFVVGRQVVKGTLQEPGDAQHYLRVRELGAIPTFTTRRSLPVGDALLVEDAGLAVSTPRSPMLVESFRSLLMSILSCVPHRRDGSVLVFTSALAGEGKTTVVSNTAIAMASTGYRVLLIDADLRSPSLHRVFGMDGNDGLLQWLEADSSDGAGGPWPSELEIPNLSILPVGAGAPMMAANLLMSARLPQVLAELKRHFDIVLIDTAPVLPFTDARMIGQCADGVVLVLRADRTTYQHAIEAIEQFTADRTPVIGTVLNGWDRVGAADTYYRAYATRDRSSTVQT